MPEFDNQLFFKAIYEDPEDDLIEYLQLNKDSLPEDKKEQLISTIFQRKKWKTFDYCVDKDLIHTDLFEYDSFNDRSLQPMLMQAKYFNEQDLTGFLPHFTGYLKQIDDINEELAGENFLSYALSEGLPLEMLQAIMESGIRGDFHNKAEENYLHLACKQRQNIQPGYPEAVIQLLVDSGADLNKQNIEGKTPLVILLENQRLAKPPAIQLLLDNGADVNSLDKKGITPVFVAAVHLQDSKLVQLLLQYGTPDFDHANRDGENLLNGFLRMMTSSAGAVEILQSLLEHGASLSATSLYYSKEKSGIEWVAEKPSDILKSLLDNNQIDVNETDNEGQTVLIKVCKIDANHEESVAKDLYRKVKYLLKAGADPGIEDRFDKKAVDYAMTDNTKTKIVEALIEN